MHSLNYVICLNNYYRDDTSIRTLLNYADKLHLGLTTGINCSANAQIACQEFHFVNSYYSKAPARYIRHFAFTSDTIKDEQQFLHIAYQIGLFFLNDFQVFIGVHNDTKHLHAHFIMNIVSFRTGRIYDGYFPEKEQLLSYVENLGFRVTAVDNYF